MRGPTPLSRLKSHRSASNFRDLASHCLFETRLLSSFLSSPTRRLTCAALYILALLISRTVRTNSEMAARFQDCSLKCVGLPVPSAPASTASATPSTRAHTSSLCTHRVTGCSPSRTRAARCCSRRAPRTRSRRTSSCSANAGWRT
jgi:hypothetical protein